jgi:hypothetical protein
MIAVASDGDPLNYRDATEPEAMRPKYCPRCGHELAAGGRYCSQCALPIAADERYYDFDISPRSRLIALLLCVLFGYFGVHRFYVDRVPSGVLWLLTGGLLGIGWFVDIILIATGNFRDRDDLPVLDWG